MEMTDPASPLYPYVWVDPERMGGTPCFRGTRLPVRILFEYLADGSTVEQFIEDFEAPADMVTGVLSVTPREIERGLGGARAA